MATAQLDSLLCNLRRAVLRQDGAGRTDGQLLASFIDQKDEAAFEALVRRHGPMVFGVCRRVTRNHHDAEEAFQATFLVLARKASSVKPREKVANWLHGVALRTAMKARAMTAKRRGREKQVTETPEPEAAQQDQGRDLRPLLDQELNGLPENYRLPILLCDLEGKTIREATRQLGWPQGTLAGRLVRGRRLLAKRLASRGVALSAGPLAAVVWQDAAFAAVPTSLMSSTAKAAAIVAAGRATVAGVISTEVAVLTEGVLKAVLLNKLKTAAAGLLSVGLLLGAASAVYRTQAAEPPPAEPPRGTPRAKALAQLDGKWTLVAEERNGRATPAKEVEGRRMALLISGDALVVRAPGAEQDRFRIEIDPSDSPRAVDLYVRGYERVGVREGKVVREMVDEELLSRRGIYSLEDDTLKICLVEAVQSRPTAFRTAGRKNCTLWVLKRD